MPGPQSEVFGVAAKKQKTSAAIGPLPLFPEFGLAGLGAGPKLISLFSGCGGLDLGFEKAGFCRAWANDFDADAQAVYSLNLGHIDGRDIISVGATSGAIEVPLGASWGRHASIASNCGDINNDSPTCE